MGYRVLSAIVAAAGSGPSNSLAIDEAAERIASLGWNINAEQGLSFGFAAPSGVYSGQIEINAVQMQAIESAIALWSDVANIALVREGEGYRGVAAYSQAAAILISATPANTGVAWAIEPGAAGGAAIEGDIYFNFSSNMFSNPLSGSNGFMTILHEIGHALGLEHPGEYNGGSPNYNTDAAYAEDSRQYTLMSYFSAANTGASHGGAYAHTPLLHDIAAIQLMYGANYATRADDTVYGFNSTAGRAAYALEDATSIAVFAVWDGGGTDTLDFSGYAKSQLIDLNAGTFSSTGGLIRNVAIASGVVIENAIGGSGNDIIIGNDAANSLNGRGGTNSLFGAAGDDTFVYSGGRTTFDGGSGCDTADFSGSTRGLNIALSSKSHDVWTGSNQWFMSKRSMDAPAGSGVAELKSTEKIITTKYDDNVRGDGHDNTFFYIGGYDRFDGRGGFDTVDFSRSAARVIVTHDETGLKATAGSPASKAKHWTKIENVERIIGSKFNDFVTATKRTISLKAATAEISCPAVPGATG